MKIYRITDVRAFESYGHALKILGVEKVGDKVEWQNLPIFEILAEKAWMEEVKCQNV